MDPPPVPAARLAGWVAKVPTIPPDAWPAVFARHGSDELLRGALLDGWVAADPAGLWQWIVTQKSASMLEEIGPRLFAAWAERDAPAAFDATARIASHHLRDRLRTAVVEAELSRDLASGLALAAKFGPLFTNGHMSRTWIEKDPLAAVQGLTALPGGANSFRRFYLAAAAAMLAKTDPHAFVAWLESAPRALETVVSHETFAEAPPMDTSRVIAALTAAGSGQARNDAMRGVIANAASRLSAEETLALARQHLTGWDLNRAIGDAATRAAKGDLPKAASLVSAMPAGTAVISAARGIASEWSRQDWMAAREWASRLPDAPTRRETWKQLSAAASPAQMAELAAAVTTLPVEDLSDDLLLRARNAVRAAGPEALARWMEALPADRLTWVEAMRDLP